MGCAANNAVWYATSDGGRIWRRVGRVPQAAAGGTATIVRATAETVWWSENGRLFVSSHGGVGWRRLETPWSAVAAAGTAFLGTVGCVGPSVSGAFCPTADRGVRWRRHNEPGYATPQPPTAPPGSIAHRSRPPGPWPMARLSRSWRQAGVGHRRPFGPLVAPRADAWREDPGDGALAGAAGGTLAHACLGAVASRVAWRTMEDGANYLTADGGDACREVAPRPARGASDPSRARSRTTSVGRVHAAVA